jgi:hypothetical protein
MGKAKGVKGFAHHLIYETAHVRRLVIEGRCCGKHDCPRLRDPGHVLDMNKIEGRFSNDKNQRDALLEADVGGTGEESVGGSGGNPA